MAEDRGRLAVAAGDLQDMTAAALDTFFGPQPFAWLTLIGLLAAALARPVIRLWDDAEVFVDAGLKALDRRPAYAPVEQRRTSRGPPVLPPLRPESRRRVHS